MGLAANALVTLVNTKNYLGIPDTSFDAILEMLIDAVSTAIENELKRNLVEATYTALALTGNGMTILCLPNWPVTTLTSVTEDDNLLVEGKDEDFRLHSEDGWLEKLTGVWSTTPKGIIVTYKAGYTVATTMPKDLQFAVYHRVARMWKEQKSQMWGENSRSFPDGSINMIEAEPFDKIELGILANHRRIRI